jgi:hypothetical protein
MTTKQLHKSYGEVDKSLRSQEILGSSPWSQRPATRYYLEHVNTSYFCTIQYQLLTPSSYIYLPFGFPIKKFLFPISPTRGTRPTHLTLLDFMALIIFGVKYEPWSFSLCSFTVSCLLLSFLGLNILLNHLTLYLQDKRKQFGGMLQLGRLGPIILVHRTEHNISRNGPVSALG